ncbi:hypothetical protein PoB_003361500 [Plakobranchus ocellatus]|uniref:Integrase catalytic domain-containing protein n=1 Tax=Plakobranchus ocellatus TaxID=259542 RepID=A0AAV4AJU7_9GAST|nr:hypothetical protein PoB_003361500 [Plakobranchus ocellatus]
MFSRHDIPKIPISDNGPNYVSPLLEFPMVVIAHKSLNHSDELFKIPIFRVSRRRRCRCAECTVVRRGEEKSLTDTVVLTLDSLKTPT